MPRDARRFAFRIPEEPRNGTLIGKAETVFRSDDLVDLDQQLVLEILARRVRHSQPVLRDTRASGQRDLALKHLRNRAQPGRVDHIQLATESEWIANESTAAIGPGRQRVENLTSKNGTAQC